MTTTIRSACARNLRNAFVAYAKTARATTRDITELLSHWPDDAITRILYDWEVWARDDQLPPADVARADCGAGGTPWRQWLILGGRGAGKTRAGAEWVRAQALGRAPFATTPAKRIALVGETLHDVRSVMVEGISGLLAVHPDHERPTFEPSKALVTWPNGAIAQLFSAESPDSLRGPQFVVAWCDEIAKWRYGQETWDMLQFALRLGDHPRVVATTTPRPVALLTDLMALDTTVVSRSRTHDNAANLAASFLEDVRRRYGGTMLGRQELDGELLVDLTGALWRGDWISDARIRSAPEMQRIVVAVDPPVSTKATSDECGIVVAGVGTDARCYVLADRTIKGRAPNVWARAAIAAYADFKADRIVAEANQGGDLVTTVIRQSERNVAISMVHATRGKWVRAEPVAALYAEGRVVHVGELPELEVQMLAFGRDGRAAGRSPDRVDALVWAVTDLMLGSVGPPSLRVI